MHDERNSIDIENDSELEIAFATLGDFDCLLGYDKHILGSVLKEKIHSKKIIVAKINGAIAGWLRYNLFWDEIPFINMLFVLERYQGIGIGTRLVNQWEEMMLSDGFEKAMTSTLEQESAQHFYRKLGYTDLGKFLPFTNEYEIMLGKRLNENNQ